MSELDFNYASLHNHTQYSNLKLIDSINREDELIDYAYELGMSGVALTEHDALSGHFKAIEYFNKKYKDNERGFKLILGNEIYICSEGMNSETHDSSQFYHFILLAKDKIGHKQLRELSSRAWGRGYMRTIMRTPTYVSDIKEIVGADPGHLVATTACIGGYTGKMYLKYNLTEDNKYFTNMVEFMAQMESIFGKDNFFIEIQPSHNDDQIGYNTFMLSNFLDRYNFTVATDSHYLKKEDFEVHKWFLNSKSSNDRETELFYSSAYMMGIDELYDYFKDYISVETFKKICDNTNKIAAQVESYSLAQDQVVTQVEHEEVEDNRMIFDDYLEGRPYLTYYMTTEDYADKYYGLQLAKGMIDRDIQPEKMERYCDRIELELEAIKTISEKMNKPLSDYFTSFQKMLNIFWEEADSIVGVSRGSAGCYLTNYILGITQMNPMEQGIEFPYWRFLHGDRPGLPDIDVDTESFKRAKVFKKVQDYFRSIGGDLVNICTFGTEGTKSALKTAGRGLNINDEIITYLTSMIPNERGFDWTLDQCYFGDEDHPQIKAFKQQMDQYPQLWQLAHKIEGLITRLGVHASGVVAVNTKFTDYNSIMKTSKGQIVSAFELHDSEAMGLIKYDFLTVSALDRIRQTMNYLLENGIWEWQGTLRETYNHYIAPDVLDYTSTDMWKMVGDGKITALFQFDTVVGSQAIKQLQPTNTVQLALANGAMRLSNDGELPLDRLIRYKNNINEWYVDMSQYGLTADEIKVLESEVLSSYGLAISQEAVMRLSMNPHISGFTMGEANALRKTIAKKIFRDIEKVRQQFYDKGLSLGTRKQMLDYVWNEQVKLSLSYSFSDVHGMGYSLIALQEMNLAYKYPLIYWTAACLSVDSSAINEEDFYNLSKEGVVNVDSDEEKKAINKMDYAKIATAISRFKDTISVSMPDINESRLGFTPDAKNNEILYGLKGIVRVTAPVIEEIMCNRPYSSLEDFCNKVNGRIVTKDKKVNLIKCGAFNRIENKTTAEVLHEFIEMVADHKNRLTMQNANMLFDKDILPDKFHSEYVLYKLTKELRKHRDSNKWYYILNDIEVDEDMRDEALTLIQTKTQMKDVEIDGIACKVIDSLSWDKQVYEPGMAPVKSYINENEIDLLEDLNQTLFDEEYNKYCRGDDLQWELDSVHFYHNEHPLKKVIEQLPVEISRVDEIVEGATDGMFFIKGREIPKMKLYTIAGTVIDKDNMKGIVTVQTPDAIVSVKIYKDLFALYNQTIINDDEDGDGEVIEDSFFEIGTHLMITGIMRGVTFLPKTYKTFKYKPIMKILLDENGDFKDLMEKSA